MVSVHTLLTMDVECLPQLLPGLQVMWGKLLTLPGAQSGGGPCPNFH